MEWFRDKKNRGLLSVAAGMLACIVVFGGTDTEQSILTYNREQNRAALGWWGSLYPQFCFSEKPEEVRREEEKTGETARAKPAFWLARALDW